MKPQIATVGSEFVISGPALQLPIPSATATTMLDNGNVVVTWMTYTAGGSGYGAQSPRVRGRLYDQLGNALGPEFNAATTNTNQEWPSVAPLQGGGFLITWQANDGPGGIRQAHGRVFGADGVAAEADFIVNTTPETSAIQYLNPSATALADGRVVVSWQADDAANAAVLVRARLFDADGTPTGGDFVVNTTAPENQSGIIFPSGAATLSDGGFFLTWESRDQGDGSGGCIRGRSFHADGSPAGNDFIVNTTTSGYQQTPRIATLADGHFVVAWIDEGQGRAARARLYNADGSPAGNDFSLGFSSDQLTLAMVGLADGRFVTAYAAPGSRQRDIVARIFNSDGSADGLPFTVNTHTGGDQVFSALAALPDGRFAVNWTSYPDLSVRAQIFDATVFSGVAGADLWRGGDLADQISGLGGADTLYGNAGDDALDGGTGSDVLDGGTGADALSGGTSDDTYYVDNAADQVFEAVGQGTDTVYASASWTMAAGQEIEFLRAITGATGLGLGGNEFRNTIYGGNGGDMLTGGGGVDRLYGGADDDTFIVRNGDLLAKEIYDGGMGTDTLQGLGSALTDLSGAVLTSIEKLEGLAAGVRLTATQLAGFDVIDTGTIRLTTGGTIDLTGATVATGTIDLSDKGTTLTLAADIARTVNGGAEGSTITVVGAVGATLNGAAGNDRLNGGDGDDLLSGSGGKDRLNGGAGDDVLIGGRGLDTETGGAGADRFVLLAASNSIVGDLRDVITDFEQGSDRIDLTAMGTFHLLAQAGAAFTGSPDELRFYTNGRGTTTFIEGDVDGDAHRDFQIQLTGGFTLTQGDFM